MLKNSDISLEVSELRAFFEKYLGEELSQNSIIKPIHNDATLKTALNKAKLLNMEDPTDPHNQCYNPNFENIIKNLKNLEIREDKYFNLFS